MTAALVLFPTPCQHCGEALPPAKAKNARRKVCDACLGKRIEAYRVHYYHTKMRKPRACKECGVTLAPGTHHQRCIDCGGRRERRYRAAYWRENQIDARVRAAAIALLGGKCVRCGFSDARALQLDHIHGAGIRDRRSTTTRYRAVLKGSTDFQLLCANCNWIKRCENGEVTGYLSK